MPTVLITNWRVDKEQDKIMLSVSIDNEIQEVELPLDFYKELLVEGPPSERKQWRLLQEEVQRIRKDRILKIEVIDKQIEAITGELDGVISALDNASLTKTDVERLRAKAGTINSKSNVTTERRHLAKFLMQEEGRIGVELARLRNTGT